MKLPDIRRKPKYPSAVKIYGEGLFGAKNEVFWLPAVEGYLVRMRTDRGLIGTNARPINCYVAPDFTVYEILGPLEYQLRKLTKTGGFEETGGFDRMMFFHDLAQAHSTDTVALNLLMKAKPHLALVLK